MLTRGRVVLAFVFLFLFLFSSIRTTLFIAAQERRVCCLEWKKKVLNLMSLECWSMPDLSLLHQQRHLMCRTVTMGTWWSSKERDLCLANQSHHPYASMDSAWTSRL